MTLRAWEWLATLSRWLSVPLGIYGVGCILAATWMLGEMVHVLAIRGMRASITAFDWVEQNTATGVVGITGFVLLLVGFALQMYANYLAL